MTERGESWSRRGLLTATTGLAAGLSGCALPVIGGSGGNTAASGPDDAESPTTGPTDGTVVTPTATTDPLFPGYETTDVRVETPDGQRLGSVNAAIADTSQLRYTGLSDTPSLPEDRGMLFVYDDVAERTYVMRGMSFPLDMIFAGGDGVINVIHQAPQPDPGQDGNDIRRSGQAQYILEVNRGWSAERGVEAGDVLRFELP